MMGVTDASEFGASDGNAQAIGYGGSSNYDANVFDANGTPQNQKYLTWTYEGKTYPIGELMILSGNPGGSIDSEEIGWNLSSQDLAYPGGGITITNPHAAMDVKLEIMVAR